MRTSKVISNTHAIMDENAAATKLQHIRTPLFLAFGLSKQIFLVLLSTSVLPNVISVIKATMATHNNCK